jgi:hypothetical protein
MMNGFVDETKVLSANNNDNTKGTVGLMNGGDPVLRNTAFFDTLLINIVNWGLPHPETFADLSPIYKK